jgi:hypothetical protein
MDPTVIRLADALDELAEFLAGHSEPAWADWVAKDAARLRQGDGSGVTHFLSAFGGMGSLNDLAFDPINGNAASAAEGAELQERFELLCANARELADGLRRAAQD